MMMTRAHPLAPAPSRVVSRRTARTARAARSRASSSDENVGVGLRAAWYGAEAFGRVMGASAMDDDDDGADAAPIASREDAVRAIRADYDAAYFVTGAGDMARTTRRASSPIPLPRFAGWDGFAATCATWAGTAWTLN